jgi:hypothetical protein
MQVEFTLLLIGNIRAICSTLFGLMNEAGPKRAGKAFGFRQRKWVRVSYEA